ncbi:thyroid receptor-interacting protein 11 isoform X1 [Lucilia cuprina]|uniref:thyroid receptor-interacting protein 11 isoform X1 n=2 Tax=Lucilia cuprina TaxID=7375 RepID=UPI001F0531DF|nr:thyroid receptor-interacting protein 11 isoform X1 [Lucilia cuprina]
MSWLNNSLNTIKGQLTTLAQEILEETAGPGDAEYHRSATPTVDNRTAIEILADTQKDKEDLDKLCSEKDIEILALRKQIETLQNQISDTGGGISGNTISGGINSGRTSKTPTDNNASNLEDSWCWEPDNNKTENDHSSETSSGNGNEMVNITLEEIPLGASAKASTKTKIQRLGAGSSSQNAELQKRIQQLEEENKQLNNSLEELDTQHNLAMQNMLELKTDLQEKLAKVTKHYEALKATERKKFNDFEQEIEKYKKKSEQLEKDYHATRQENQEIKQKLESTEREMKRSIEEMADLQTLLEKKSLDNNELLQRIKELTIESEQEKVDLSQKLDMLSKELEELKVTKSKKTSESSTSSTSKQSEDEFIVVREQDATSSGPATPPSKEELKDKIVQLENRVSELTLENGSLSLKLQDREMEKDLSINVLKESVKSLQTENDELADKLRMTLIDLEDQQFKINDLKEKASEAIIAQEQLKALAEEKHKFAQEIEHMKENLNKSLELEKRLLIAEQEKETLQIELQNQKASQQRINELEQKIQNLTYKNQQLQLNAECETETLNNSNELEQKLKVLHEENDHLKSELERLTDSNFSRAIADEKHCITDLDEEDEDEGFSLEKLKSLLKVFTTQDVKEMQHEDIEKLYKHLRDKLHKLETTERELAHMSSEMLELQDNKLVWDHEKKTLEADISQYILQCDELMKNNEILLNELENYKRNKLETISENNEENIVQLESQLEECNNLNRTLEQEYIELNEKIEELEKEKEILNEKLRTSQQQCEALNTKEKDLNLQVETLELEKCNLLLKLNGVNASQEEQQEDSQALRIYQEKCESLEKQLSTLAKDHADLVSALQKQKEQLLEAIQKGDNTEKLLREEQLLGEQLKDKVKSMENLHSLNEKLHENLKEANLQTEQFKQELMAKDIVAESLKQEVKTLQSYLQEAEGLVDSKLALEEQVNEKQQKIEELLKELKSLKEIEENMKQDLDKILAEKIDVKLLEQLKEEKALLQEKLKTLENELENLKEANLTEESNNKEHTNYLARIAELESQLLATADLQKSLEALNYEKQEMIKALQQKHAENMQYYMEIQRLTPLAQQQTDKSCDKCPSLESHIAELQKQQEKLQDQISFLKEKSDILTTNLLTEQTNQKLVQQEKADVMEQNATLRKDLERLRAHLLESEDMHTQEMVELQKEFEETKAKMIALEDEVNKSSNAYTSASIRANQHAETLQAQYALVVQQRDELVNKLTVAEDRESKNQAALTNLQCALEQFQNDKENDIKLATQRIRKELQQHLDKETQLQLEIQQLQQQLSDANQGLNAASRLSDQLEASQQTINVLREEVESLKKLNMDLEKKLSSTESSQTDKIEKSLIKSLLIGYVVSGNPNDKQQILRMISSVLDFNQNETDKVGLNKQQGGWLGSLLGGGGGPPGSHSKDNLVQAFVEFLEQESQPKPQQSQMPNLLNITHTPTTTASTNATPASRRSSNIVNPLGAASGAATTYPAPVPIQPLLLNSTVLDDFAPSRNSSSILKDILSDS